MIIAHVFLFLNLDQTKTGRVPNERTKAWATRLLNSRVTKVKVEGIGLTRKPWPTKDYRVVTISNQAEIKRILKAFQSSTRRARDDESGHYHEGSDIFTFFVADRRGKISEEGKCVLAIDIDLEWGPQVKEMYEFLRKRAKPFKQ